MNTDILNHLSNSLPWYLVRAFGLISVGLLSLMIISGMGLISGLTFRFWPPIKAWAVHKAIGLSFFFALLGHLLFLLFGKYENYTLFMILIPFTGSIWLSLGVLAFYLILILVITSLTTINSNKKNWKMIHFISYPALIFVFFHALNMGTDLKSGLLRYIWIGFGLVILGLIFGRFRRSLAVK